MNAFIDTIEKAANEIEKLNTLVKKSKAVQISRKDEKEYLKAVSLTWFHTHRPIVISTLSDSLIVHIDNNYQELLRSADISPKRQRCVLLFKNIKADLHRLRNENITAVATPVAKTIDSVPNFSTVVGDA